ncbi:IS66-like element accessory protein TnpA [Aquabacterium sp. OR-4]|uniref:IS66-like element accessory protein TnpA n=1 Tax=Aquabacterium sp. OR-4 TaxID=2978127 RepID=UPI0021B4B454|nr:transposase [Aquabacterium sp. OR-4]MDT7837467.1 transposase [Aquabacterium sp. OR-4]
MDTEKSRKRRRHSAELKAQILAECAVPGASVAKVAMAHGINANIVHGWRKLAREAGAVTVSQQFVPVAVATTAVPSADKQAIEVELRRGAITVKLSWPMSSVMDLSGWMRELLR